MNYIEWSAVLYETQVIPVVGPLTLSSDLSFTISPGLSIAWVHIICRMYTVYPP